MKTTNTNTKTDLLRYVGDHRIDDAVLAAIAFLARYSNRTLDAYRPRLEVIVRVGEPIEHCCARNDPATQDAGLIEPNSAGFFSAPRAPGLTMVAENPRLVPVEGLNVAMMIQPWSVRAVNLPEHADNPIHTDAGAVAEGFPRALVAGVTVYAVLTRPVAEADPAWPKSGGGEVRFRSPVFDGDLIDMVPINGDNGWIVQAQVDGELRVTLASLPGGDLGAVLADSTPEKLEPLSVVLDGTYADYGQRSGDDLALYDDGMVHPSIWLKLANRVFAEQLVRGAWVHTRSRFVHHDRAEVGTVVTVSGEVVRRFTTSAGERAVAVLRIDGDRGLLAEIEHEAIVSMTS